MISVEVVYVAASGESWRRVLHVPEGSSLTSVMELSGARQEIMGYDWADMRLGVYGQRVEQPSLQQARAGDQIEIYRPLLADPKLKRKARAGRGGR